MIITNEKGYSLHLSGMDELITITGNKVLIESQLQKITPKKSAKKTKKRVYFELRYKGKVIDPKREAEIL